MQEMKIKNTFFKLAFLVLFFFPGVAFSNHFTTAEIAFINFAPNQYVVKLIINKTCGPTITNLPSSLLVNWISPSGCGPVGSGYLNLVPGTGAGNSIPTSSYPSCGFTACHVPPGTALGIDQYWYTGVVTLPSSCVDWKISFTDCCRNLDISTGPANGILYVETSLDNLNFPSDNSPDFNHPSVATTCVGRPFVFHLDGTDPDGDSLVYILADSWSAAGVPSMYTTPYSGNYPVDGFPLPSLNSQTGELTLHPSMIQIGLFSILVESYDRTSGLLKSTVRRDALINVEAICNDTPHFDSTQVSVRIATMACNDSVLHMKLSWPFNCSTLASNGSDFRLLSPANIPIILNNAIAHNCNAMGLSDSLTLFSQIPLNTNGMFKLISKIGTDGNTILNSCGLALPEFDTCYFSFNNCPVGFDEQDKNASFLKIYPNPSDHFLRVSTNIHGIKKIRINNPIGRCIWSCNYKEDDFTVDLGSLPNGIYSLEALNEKGLKSAFFVVQH